jgi:hypothetical protein
LRRHGAACRVVPLSLAALLPRGTTGTRGGSRAAAAFVGARPRDPYSLAAPAADARARLRARGGVCPSCNSIVQAGAVRRQRSLDFTRVARRPTRDSATSPIRRRSRRSSPSCAPPATARTVAAARADRDPVASRPASPGSARARARRGRSRPATWLAARPPRQGRTPTRGRHGRLGLAGTPALARVRLEVAISTRSPSSEPASVAVVGPSGTRVRVDGLGFGPWW